MIGIKQGIKREREEQLALANMLNRIALAASDVGELTEEFARELKRVIPIDWATVANVGTSGIATLLPLSSKISSSLDFGNSFPLRGTPVAWVAENKCTALEADLGQERRFEMSTYWLKQGMRSLVFLPLFYQGEVFGTVILASRKANAYGERELKLLRYAASQLATQIKNFELSNRNQKQEKWLVTLDGLVRTITSGEELSEVFPQLAQELGKVIPLDRLALTSLEGEILRIIGVFRDKEHHPWVGEIYPARDSAIPWMIEHRRINIAEDFAQVRQFAVDELHFKEGLRAEVRIPFFSHGRLFANLHVSSSQPYHFDKEELSLLDRLSSYLAGSMESLILHSSRRERIDWFNTVTHQIKTLITPVTSSSLLLTRELGKTWEPDSLLQQLGKNIEQGASRLSTGVRFFEELGRIELAQFSLNLEIVDIESILREVCDDTITLLETNSQVFTVTLPRELPQVFTDSSKAEEVVRILLDNAIKRTPSGGEIGLNAKSRNREVIIEVTDDGERFSPEEIQRLLGHLRPAEVEYQAFPELALSLALCHRLVELLGGRFWLNSKDGKGATFGFSLPVR